MSDKVPSSTKTKPKKVVKKPLASRKYDSVSQRLGSLLSSEDTAVPIEEISHEFWVQIGGAPGYVKKVLSAYDISRVGSAEQARLLDIMNDMFKLTYNKKLGADMDQVSDEDLMQAAVDIAKDVNVYGIPVLGFPDHVCI